MAKFSFKSLFSRTPGRFERHAIERRKNTRHEPEGAKSILIVDDSKTARMTLKRMLDSGGYTIYEAEDGVSAISMAQQKLPDLILMDVVMPGINGFVATRRIRKMEDTKNIPIVIMSGNEQATEEFWVIRIGANDFMAKPFNRSEVYRRVERLLFQNEII